MLGTIEELEKSIEEFQNNMAASGELCRLLEDYVQQAKRQEESFNKKAEALLQKVEEIPSVIDAKNTESNIAVQTDVSAKLGEAVRDFSEEQKKYIAAVVEVSKKVVSSSEVIVNQMKSSQSQYSEELTATQKELKTCENQLEQKYREFTQTLDAMNVANLYEQNQELKKTLNTRTIILTVLSVVSVIVGIIGFFI